MSTVGRVALCAWSLLIKSVGLVVTRPFSSTVIGKFNLGAREEVMFMHKSAYVGGKGWWMSRQDFGLSFDHEWPKPSKYLIHHIRSSLHL